MLTIDYIFGYKITRTQFLLTIEHSYPASDRGFLPSVCYLFCCPSHKNTLANPLISTQ